MAGRTKSGTGRTSRQRLVIALAATLVISLLGTVGAYADSPPVGHSTVEGTVTDALGRPIEGVDVWIFQGEVVGSDVTGRERVGVFDLVETDVNGNYSFTYQHSSSVRVSLHGIVGTTEAQPLATPMPGEYRVDFANTLYSLTAGGWRRAITTLPGSVPLTVVTTAPVGDLCVTATDSRTGATVPMNLATGSGYQPPYSRWTGTIDVPTTTVAGNYAVAFVGTDCVSGTRLTMNPYYPPSYLVDLAAPSVTITQPTTAHTYAQGQDLGASPDGETRVIGELSVGYHATDDGGLESVKITVTSADGKRQSRTQLLYGQDSHGDCYDCFTLLPGAYTLTVVVTDRGGRTSAPATQTFVEVTG